MDDWNSEATPLLSQQSQSHSNGWHNEKKKHTVACLCILIAEGLERLAFYSLFANLLYLLTTGPLCWFTPLATAAQLVPNGIVYAIGLLAGWLSDAYFGRFRNIIIGYIIYIIGYAYFPILGYFVSGKSANGGKAVFEGDKGTECYNEPASDIPFCYEDSSHMCSTTMYASLVLVSIGAGIVRTNLAPFGGDQVRDDGMKAATSFFTYYYWSINVGSFIAYLPVMYLQQYVSFFYGYLVPFSCIVISFIVFLCGSKIYVKYPSGSRILSTILEMYKNAWQVRRLMKDTASQSGQHMAHLPVIDYAKLNHGGMYQEREVEQVKNLWKATIVFILLIPYWICYSQMSGNLYLLQGLHLRLNFAKNNSKSEADDLCPDRYNGTIGNEMDKLHSICDNHTRSFNGPESIDEIKSYNVPAATFQLFNVVFIIITLPLVQRLYKCLSSRGINIYTWKRMVFGFMLAVCSLVAAGVLELERLSNILQCGFHYQEIGYTIYESAAAVSIWWQVIQYSLMGASEVFAIVTGIEYAYTMAPQALQGLIMGLFWFTAGLGDFLAIAIPYIFHSVGIWRSDTFINCNRLDWLFFILAIFLIIFTIVFALCAVYVDLGLHREVIERKAIAQQICTPQNSRRMIRRASTSYGTTNGSRSSLSTSDT